MNLSLVFLITIGFLVVVIAALLIYRHESFSTLMETVIKLTRVSHWAVIGVIFLGVVIVFSNSLVPIDPFGPLWKIGIALIAIFISYQANRVLFHPALHVDQLWDDAKNETDVALRHDKYALLVGAILARMGVTIAIVIGVLLGG